MNLIYKVLIISFSLFCASGFFSCTDDLIDPSQGELSSDIPDDMKVGPSISFNLSLDPMGGAEFAQTRVTSTDMTEIEDFIDLEKLRILFFTCLDDNDETGKSDIFLFESKSRWVSELETSGQTGTKRWQVTAPVFTYGNNDEYDWEYIRTALTSRPFKIAILANRPDSIRYGDFDGSYGKGEFWFGNRGPYWGVKESEKGMEDYKAAMDNNSFSANSYSFKGTSINGLHHCQWDPVYANKNLINNKPAAADCNGNNVYDFILGSPNQNLGDINSPDNWMGAVSSWTKKIPGDTETNWYFFPDKTQGIPMYGVQVFDAIPSQFWISGTPYNISESQTGQTDTYHGKTISMLRSLVRLDFLIPKVLGGKAVTVSEVTLNYSNVMGRCEPLNVAKPTDQLWYDGICDEHCELDLIQKRGPVIDNDNYGTVAKGTVTDADRLKVRDNFVNRIAWYYGSWKDWWDFNNQNVNCGDGPYPQIFNPCVQRNATARLDYVMVEDPNYYYYMVYTGERNINDPSNFRDLTITNSELCFFQFTVAFSGVSGSKTYCIAITDYGTNTLIKNYLYSGVNFKDNTTVNNVKGGDSYRYKMATDKQGNWNWALLRNHIYRFTVNSINGNVDNEGYDVIVVSTEQRNSPSISYE